MADLDSLQIQITASTTKADTAIEKLVGALTDLNNVLSNSASYVGNLNSLTSGLSGFRDAVSGIDTARIKDVSSAMRSLANAGTKLSSVGGSGAISSLANGLQALNAVNVSAENVSNILSLSNAIGKMGGKGSNAAVTNLPQIAKAINSFNGITIPNIEGLSTFATAVRGLGTKSVVRAASSLPQIVTALQGFSNVTIPNIEGITSLGTSLKSFGSANAQKAATNLPILANGFKELITTLSSAPSVSSNTLRLAEAMAQIAANGGRAGSTINSVSRSLAGYSTSANRAAKHSRSLASTIGTLYAKFFLVLRAFRAIGKAIGYASDMTEVANVVATTFGDATKDVQEFADTAIMSFGMAELSAKQYASRFQAMGVAMGVTTEQVASASEFLTGTLANTEDAYKDLGDSMADVSINLTKLTADMASFYNVDYADVADDLESVFTGMTRPLRQYGLDLTEATLKEWAFKNGLDSNIESMTQAEKTMLRYQYVMANMGHVMGDFADTADTWANVTRTIGQQFQKLGQIIGQGFINTFKPVLIGFRNFMNTLIDLTEKGLNAIGKLLGWQVEIEDVGTTIEDDAEDYASSIDDAADSAKKLLRLLLPIDELNLLPSDNDSGSGSGSSSVSGGGASSTLTGGGLTLVPYESDIESWYELGQKFAEKVTEGLNSIDWDSIYEKAANFGKNLAELLNGSINPEEFYAIGKTIAGAMNTAVYAALNFAETFDWENAGTSLGAAINGWLENFDFKAAAGAISNFATGILEWATSAIEKVDWETAGEKLVEFFMGIDWKKIWTDINSLAEAIFEAIVKAGKGAIEEIKNDPGAFGEAVLNFSGIALLIGGMKLTKAILANLVNAKLAALIGGSTAGGAASLGTLGTVAVLVTVAFVGEKIGEQIGKSIFGDEGGYYENFSWFGEGGFFDTFIGSIKDGTIGEALKLMWENCTPPGALFTKYQEFQDELDEIGDKRSVLQIAWEQLTPNGKVFKGWQDLGATIEENGGLMDGYIVPAFEGAWENIVSYWETTAKPWIDKTPIGDLVSVFQDDTWKEDVSGSFETLWGYVQDYWSGTMQPWFNDSVLGDIISTFTSGEWKDKVKESFQNLWDKIQEIFSKAWSLPELKTPHISWTSGGASASGWVKEVLEALSLPTSLPKLNVEWYAEGGYPSMGSLFVANEAGPEMVGTIGGKTAVANNDQIVSAVSQGVAQAVASVMGGRNGNQTIQMVVDGKVLYQTVVNENNRQISRTGASAIRT